MEGDLFSCYRIYPCVLNVIYHTTPKMSANQQGLVESGFISDDLVEKEGIRNATRISPTLDISRDG